MLMLQPLSNVLCREVIPYLLASLVYHKPYLLKMQCDNAGHPLLLQRVWTSGVLDRLQLNVEAGCNRNERSRMFATGVPPHLVLANSIVGMQRELDVLRTDVITKLDNLPEALKQCMLQNFNVDGTIPITHVQVVDMLSELKTSLENSFVTAIREDRQSNSIVQVPSPMQIGDQTTFQGGKHFWSWKGRLHPVPLEFRFPK